MWPSGKVRPCLWRHSWSCLAFYSRNVCCHQLEGSDKTKEQRWKESYSKFTPIRLIYPSGDLLKNTVFTQNTAIATTAADLTEESIGEKDKKKELWEQLKLFSPLKKSENQFALRVTHCYWNPKVFFFVCLFFQTAQTAFKKMNLFSC